ncbi:MAG TPA: YciI family protein [Methylomirabilota bacterium]|jgi:hypothetical protein
MRYMLLICGEEKADAQTPKAEMESLIQGHMRFGEELRAAGKFIEASRLRPEADASRVRVKAGQRHVMDGPFAETKEILGGFYLIECGSKQEAIEWAKKVPLRETGYVEVRPIWQM